jgi:hypothetical protein
VLFVIVVLSDEIHVDGGFGKELADGDSKHLLAAKNEFVGDPLRLRRVVLLTLLLL